MLPGRAAAPGGAGEDGPVAGGQDIGRQGTAVVRGRARADVRADRQPGRGLSPGMLEVEHRAARGVEVTKALRPGQGLDRLEQQLRENHGRTVLLAGTIAAHRLHATHMGRGRVLYSDHRPGLHRR